MYVTNFFRLAARLLFLPGTLVIRWIDRRSTANGAPTLGWFRRGAVHAFLAFIALVVVTSGMSTPTSSPTVANASAPTTAPHAPSAPPVSVPQPTSVGEQVMVSRVIDGDTFETSDGRSVRVLGIDSCEKDTPGGVAATNDGLNLLTSGRPVYLITEPGVTTDRYGRHLRYVQAGGQDYGTFMVGWDHTGVYQGANDASAAYVASLYANDLAHAKNPPSGRDCGALAPPAPADDSGPVYVPGDGDDDNDRESRFCRGKWWC
jgi:endonuclease YncB( thermonuclease family)